MAVRQYLQAVVTYIADVREEDPKASTADVLSRRDVQDMLADTTREAQAYVLQVLMESWEDGGSSDYTTYGHLVHDVGKSYAIPSFVSSLKGRSGGAQAHIRRVALRNSLTVQYAARYSAVHASLQTAGPSASKVWHAHPEDPACCFWCRRLNGVTIPLKADFGPHLGGPAVLSASGRLTKPPKTYHGRLLCPPLHPWCNCFLSFSSGADSAGQSVEDMPSLPFVSSAEIRAMSSAKYRVLIEFMKAAAHELGQVLRRLQRS